jgi:hypothetical protein
VAKKRKNGGQTMTRSPGTRPWPRSAGTGPSTRPTEPSSKHQKDLTKKTYKKAQGEWASFCKKYEFEDGDFVNADKLIWFTQEVVLTRRVKQKARKQKKDAQGGGHRPRRGGQGCGRGHLRVLPAWNLGPGRGRGGRGGGQSAQASTAEVWVSAAIEPVQRPDRKGSALISHPRGFAVRSTLKDVQSKAWKRIRELHDGRAANTILDAYTPQDLQNFVRRCWTAGTRANVDSYVHTLLVGHYFLVRVELRRVAVRDAPPDRKYVPGMLVLDPCV